MTTQNGIDLPHDECAERAVLGSMLLINDVISDVAEIVAADDFHNGNHAEICNAIFTLHNELGADGIDVVTVGDQLEKRKLLERVGGHGYLMELLQGVPHAANARHYSGVVRDLAERRRAIIQTEECLRLATIPDSDPEVIRAARDTIPIPGEGRKRRRMALTTLADVIQVAVQWLWPNRIPQSKLTLIVGDPGLGKSFLTIEMAARVSAGRPWIDAPDTPVPAGDVLIFSAEDDPADTILPRLINAGGDPHRVHFVEGIAESARRNERPRFFRLEEDVPVLDELLGTMPECRLVIIDPVSAYGNGKTDTHRNSDVRAQLAPLSELAARHRVAIVIVSHLSKGGGAKAIYRAMGSLAYVAAVRIAWLLEKDRDDEERRLLVQLKNNITSDQLGLAFRLFDGCIEWETGLVEFTANDLLSAETCGRDGGQRNEAEDFLRDYLAEGPQNASEVQDAAEAAGIGPKPLRKAREKICHSRKASFNSGWVWELKDHRTDLHVEVPSGLEDAQDVHSQNGSTWAPSDVINDVPPDWTEPF